ncbi:MAG: hypothetical protein MUC38_02285 [Cyclobacteriaceae bacterium]|jgi:hypothetical protein|nr:hypothetical protein [Cyclobacteriaceae bacterium]
MIRFFLITASLFLFSCSREQKDKKKRTDDDSDNLAISTKEYVRDSTFFERSNDAYSYRNVKFYFRSFDNSPYFAKPIIVKEAELVKRHRKVDLIESHISLEIFSEDDDSLSRSNLLEHKTDLITLYSHHYECLSYPEAIDDWFRIQLFVYDNPMKPFATSDERYWLFAMNFQGRFKPRTNYFLTFEKDFDNRFFYVDLCDKTGLLQRVSVIKKNDREVQFWSPSVDIVSNNPYQYEYTTEQSPYCTTMALSVSDTTDLRRHITQTIINLKFVAYDGLADSVSIPINNGLFFGSDRKVQEVQIFKED